MPKGPTPGPDPSSKQDLALLLRDAVRHSVQVEREAAAPAAPKSSSRRPIAIAGMCGLVLAFCAWSFVARPDFIWGTGAVVITPERAEAGMRLAMFLQARRLDLYREREGEYPEALREVGGDTSLGYRRLDERRFALTATVAGRQLVLTSDADREAFLGNSLELVQQRVKR